MLDIGWSEMLVIAVVAIVIIGPKDLPTALRTFGRWMGKARAMARDFQNSLDEIARESELDEIRKQIDEVSHHNIAGEIEKKFDDATGETTGTSSGDDAETPAEDERPEPEKASSPTAPDPAPAADVAAKS